MYVVLAKKWKSKYEDLLFGANTTNTSIYTKYASRIEPIFVDCPEGYYGEAPCCKQDKGLTMIQQSYDFYVYMDDDVYIRHDFLLSFLSLIPTEDMVVIVGSVESKRLGQTGYLRKQKRTYNCSDEILYPWGQPAIYTHSTLQYIQNGLKHGGITKQCLEYGVLHDVGNALFHFMYQLDYIYLDVASFMGNFREELYGMHRIGRGGGDAKGPGKETMYYVHQRFQIPRYAKEKWPKHKIRRFQSNEYQTTKTYKLYGEPSTWSDDDQWHTMPIRDCMGENNW